jgi:hypothetical protein
MTKKKPTKQARSKHADAVAKCFDRMASYSDSRREALDEKLKRFLCPDSGAQVVRR